MEEPSSCFFELCFCNMELCLVSSVSPSLKRLKARLNRHHSEINSLLSGFLKSL